MSWMNSAGEFRGFAEPSPRNHELPFEPYQFATKTRRLLPVPTNVASSPCLDVLHRRRSRRVFGVVTHEQLSALLWFSAKTLQTRRESSGFTWQHRPAPSGGGRHPVHILTITPAADRDLVSVYEPEGHALLDLDLPKSPATDVFLREIDSVLPPQLGTVLCFAADHTRTMTRYKNGESLVWRDAGALLATIHIAAEALSINCCAVGLLCDNWIADILPPSRFRGAGIVVIGSR